mmetsp:Transcript_48495/g.136414  ORF Transcript_48495/g.136414 Transcript_48495/m.136414 type:complete len:372 (+) Transcript_48495:75-1190(+)
MIAAGLAVGAVSASAASIAWSIRALHPDAEFDDELERTKARATKAKAVGRRAPPAECKVAAAAPDVTDEVETIAPPTPQSSFAETVASSPSWTPAETLAELQRGNERFRFGKSPSPLSLGAEVCCSPGSDTMARAAAKLHAASSDGGQRPGLMAAHAVAAAAAFSERRPSVAVLACGGPGRQPSEKAAEAWDEQVRADARAIFDAGPGDLLTIAVSEGNKTDEGATISEEGWKELRRAAHEMEVKVIVVLGASGRDTSSPGSHDDEQVMGTDVAGVVEQLARDDRLMERVRNLDLMIIGANRDSVTGAVTFFHEVSGYFIADKNFARRPCRGVRSCYTPPTQQGLDCQSYEVISRKSSQDLNIMYPRSVSA